MFDLNNIKMEKKSYKNILIYHIGLLYAIKDLKYVKIIFDKLNRSFEEINGSKYLMLVPTNKSKEIIKKFEKLWSKIRDLI